MVAAPIRSYIPVLKYKRFLSPQTNSAYMLFYERCPVKTKEQIEREEEQQEKEPSKKFNFELSKELEQVCCIMKEEITVLGTIFHSFIVTEAKMWFSVQSQHSHHSIILM